MSTNVTAGVVHRLPRWRNVYKSPQEEIDVVQRDARPGMVPYHHIIGGENGMGEDRWLEPARKYFDWMAKHDAHFVNKRSIANIGVVTGQRTHCSTAPPRSLMEYMDGMYYACRRSLPLTSCMKTSSRPRNWRNGAAAQHRIPATSSRQLRHTNTARCLPPTRPACTTSGERRPDFDWLTFGIGRPATL
jgi:hypothetical protein